MLELLKKHLLNDFIANHWFVTVYRSSLPSTKPNERGVWVARATIRERLPRIGPIHRGRHSDSSSFGPSCHLHQKPECRSQTVARKCGCLCCGDNDTIHMPKHEKAARAWSVIYVTCNELKSLPAYIGGLPMCVLSYIFAWHRGSSGQRPWVRLLHSLVHCHLARLCEDLFSAAIRDRERSSRG